MVTHQFIWNANNNQFNALQIFPCLPACLPARARVARPCIFICFSFYGYPGFHLCRSIGIGGNESSVTPPTIVTIASSPSLPQPKRSNSVDTVFTAWNGLEKYTTTSTSVRTKAIASRRGYGNSGPSNCVVCNGGTIAIGVGWREGMCRSIRPIHSKCLLILREQRQLKTN